VLKVQQKAPVDTGPICPKCHVPLSAIDYEGVSIQQCSKCCGVLVEENDIQRILARKIVTFDDRIASLAALTKAQQKIMRKPLENYLYAEDGLVCPKCRHARARMYRNFYNLLYKVEIDRCQYCGLVWFDKDELEILQCLYEEEGA
jgi:Zn-finger nucleic acid-binding protein